ncbi:unnamed protein product [Schistosoma mattheei]|uniref:Uncharacterized protein n=1 Tax=Schistosoma mattheei TaxID=31246 RepID=A0A3P8GFZ1_9TREM|nr:unnamed protein product [Schistosoma mattheei]
MVHTPFVPSGSWSLFAPLVRNQGFITPLGGLSVSTNSVKAPDICFSSSQFRKQHSRHGKAVSRLPWQRPYTHGYVRAFREGKRTLPTLGRTKVFWGT